MKAKGGIPQYGIDDDYPILDEMGRQADFNERQGLPVSPLLSEVSAALHELWMARSYVREKADRAE